MLRRRRPSPYHMALVTLLSSLGQGLPLASMFKIYNHLVCRIQDENLSIWQAPRNVDPNNFLPPPPELPQPPNCDSQWVEQTTSAYSAAMATVGALSALLLLERANRMTERFGRKILLLIAMLILSLGYLVFVLSTLLPPLWGAAILFAAVVTLEASQGTLLRVAVQEYVVDSTEESSRAGTLSFIEGFGQIGAFPASALGGWLAALTASFNAPFYACSAVFGVAFAYIILIVPESKKHHEATIIDELAIPEDSHTDDTASVDPPRPNSVMSGNTDVHQSRGWLDFFRPLRLFLPKTRNGTNKRDWSMLNLAVIILFEESYQVFLIPLLILYNSDILNLDVIQNGYLVSILQGSRALFLTLLFPILRSSARKLVDRSRKKKAAPPSDSERQPLLQSSARQRSSSISSATPSLVAERAGKLDIAFLVGSYVLSCGAFVLIGFSRHAQRPLVVQALGIIVLEAGAGATSIRTALVANSVDEGSQADALAASQMVSSFVFATIPLLSSLAYSKGLVWGFPELVWIFKAAFAAMAAVITIPL